MCGISGIIGENAAKHHDKVIRMTKVMAHRGPDGSAVLSSIDSHALFGMNTLAIIAPDVPLGPYKDPETGCVITYNGEIYNFRQVARSLGIQLSEHETDAHLVLRSYLRMGNTCVELFDGMFAFAIYDPRNMTALLARDRLGEKPLYYSVRPQGLHFASETKALVDLEKPGAVPAQWLVAETLLGENTPYHDIKLLAPGHLLKFRIGMQQPDREEYWSLARIGLEDQPDYSAVAERFVATLEQNVTACKPDVPFALMLSGGIDSAVLAYLMKPDCLITVRYPGRAQFDEIAKAEQIANNLRSELICIEPTPQDFLERARLITYHLDYPFGNASLFSEFMLYEMAASAGVRVVVGGLGPDEFLLGYYRHSLVLDGPDAPESDELGSYQPLRQKFRSHSAHGRSLAERYYRLLMKGPDLDPEVRRTIFKCFEMAEDVGQALTLSDLEISFPGQVLTSDKLSSAFGLERRSPYLGRSLIELCYSLPLNCKRRFPNLTKILMRDAGRQIGVPASICDERNKIGFSAPLPAWLGETLDTWSRRQLSAVVDDHSAPGLIRFAVNRALASSSKGFDRTRLNGLLLALWWQGQSAH